MARPNRGGDGGNSSSCVTDMRANLAHSLYLWGEAVGSAVTEKGD